MVWVAQDFFNRADETPLAAPWSALVGGTGINLVSNAASISGAADGDSYYARYTLPNDHWCRANITVTGTTGTDAGIGLLLRASTTARTFYRFVADHAASNNISIGRVVAGAFTNIVRVTQAFTNGDEFEFGVQGQTLYVNYKGTRILTTNDTNITTGNFAGIAASSTETSYSVDNWEAGDFYGQIGQLASMQPPNPPQLGAQGVPA